MLCFAVYFVATESTLIGMIAFVCFIFQLYIARKINQKQTWDAYPVRVYRKDDKIFYVFTHGHYYEQMNEEIDNEDELD